MKNRKEISVKSLLRRYVYTATVSTKTGNLLGIQAGCRHWQTFNDAQSHYDLNKWWGTKFDQNNYLPITSVALPISHLRPSTRTFIAHREEAIVILSRLRTKVTRYQGKVALARTRKRVIRRKRRT